MSKEKSMEKLFEEELGVVEENNGITLDDCETPGEEVELEDFFNKDKEVSNGDSSPNN